MAASTGKILAAVGYSHYAERDLPSPTAPMGRYTAAFHLRQMIQQSNNDSWALILNAIGNQRIHDYAAALRFPTTGHSTSFPPGRQPHSCTPGN